ncbi:hypothetical protein GCM10009714_20810 [Microlunatus capsulatus]
MQRLVEAVGALPGGRAAEVRQRGPGEAGGDLVPGEGAVGQRRADLLPQRLPVLEGETALLLPAPRLPDPGDGADGEHQRRDLRGEGVAPAAEGVAAHQLPRVERALQAARVGHRLPDGDGEVGGVGGPAADGQHPVDHLDGRRRRAGGVEGVPTQAPGQRARRCGDHAVTVAALLTTVLRRGLVARAAGAQPPPHAGAGCPPT